jgi:hypothetical protein
LHWWNPWFEQHDISNCHQQYAFNKYHYQSLIPDTNPMVRTIQNYNPKPYNLNHEPIYWAFLIAAMADNLQWLLVWYAIQQTLKKNEVDFLVNVSSCRVHKPIFRIVSIMVLNLKGRMLPVPFAQRRGGCWLFRGRLWLNRGFINWSSSCSAFFSDVACTITLKSE